MANRFFPNYSEYKITSKYGMRTLNGKTAMHNGIDLVAKTSAGISAMDYITAHSAGTVSAVGYDTSAGNYVYIKVAEGVLMAYFHMKDGTVAVKAGDKVKKGQTIGYMGSTGNSTGAHLHWGIKVGGKWIDPTAYLDKDYTVIAASPKYSYQGYLDTASSKSITGWCWNGVNDDACEVTLKLYLGTKLVNAFATTAGNYRADLKEAGKGDGKHGFNADISKFNLSDGTYTVRAYASNGSELKTSKKTFTIYTAPVFAVGDKIKLKAGTTYYNGKKIPDWVFKSTLYYRGTNKNGIIFSTLKSGAVTGTVKAENVIKV